MSDFFKRFVYSVLLIGLGSPLFSQDYQTLIHQFLESKLQTNQWASSDIYEVAITDSYEDIATGLQYVYAQQKVNGIPIENAILNFTFKKNQLVLSNTDRLIDHVLDKINQSQVTRTPADAVIAAVTRSIGQLYLRAKPQVIKNESPQQYLFKKLENIQDDIPVNLVFKLINDQQLNLYWKVGVHESSGAYWNNYVNATTGNIDHRINMTLSCLPEYNSNQIPVTHPINSNSLPLHPLAIQYRVWPLPLSAPNAGASVLISDPSDPLASPLGWHDDGNLKYTITKGNNAHAFADLDTNFISSNDEPSGGSGLVFDFPYNPNGTIASNKNAAVVNLFYMTNVMHDFAYNYGFTEEAGNFQTKNISGKGKGNDAVLALAQYGANNSRYRNNADFLSPADGTNGRIRMYIWNVTGTKLLKISEPQSLFAEFETGTADFGQEISQVPLIGKLVVVSDGSATSTLGCRSLINAAAVKGKIALIDRGDCFFHEKACFAQAAGAIGVIICNYENTTVGMGSIAPAPCTVTIPVLSISSTDAVFLKKNINSITITMQAPATTGTVEKDGSFDNGIIAHEYGHGISSRLTGGPSNSSCLNNDEQMGEGWSDFFSLVTTVKAGDDENTAFGIATFPLQQDASGRGIRRFPYSLNTAINDLTYEDILSTETAHTLGEIWTVMLWELYWTMTKTYGWNPDLYRGNGGNNKAIRLIFEGMRLQPCSPGFVDGRNAILKADQLLNNSENQCIIWQAFARRGLGFSAVQGTVNDRSDGTQAFDMPPTCIPTVKIAKTMTPFIKAGEEINVSLTVRNDSKLAAKNLVITDIIPESATFKNNSSNVPLTLSGNTLSHTRNELLPGESVGITYTLVSSKSKTSRTVFIDSMETTEFNYDLFALKGSGIWELTDVLARSGKKSWFVPNLSTENDQLLNHGQAFDIKNMSKPVMRFYHRYNVQHAFDGGLIRVSTDSEQNYTDLGKNIFRNGYSGPLSYFAIPLPELRAFYGDSKTFIPTYIDLNEFKNQQINLQFRFGSNDSRNATGWFIDDLEIFDMFNYNSVACVTAEGLNSICAEAPEKGTIVESQLTIPNKQEKTIPLEIRISPNPASDLVFCTTSLPNAGALIGQIFTMDGKLMLSFNQYLTTAQSRFSISTKDLSPGMYLIHIQSGAYSGREKLIIHR